MVPASQAMLVDRAMTLVLGCALLACIVSGCTDTPPPIRRVVRGDVPHEATPTKARPARMANMRVDEADRINPEWPDAIALLGLAHECDDGRMPSCWLLGSAYESLPESIDDATRARARVLFRRSCREGARGCVEAARTHPEQAAVHLAQGCRHGSASACEAWAAQDEAADEARALGCRAGWLDGCSERVGACAGTLARCVQRAESARSAGRTSEALRLSREACDGERTAGCEVYARASAQTDALAAEAALERACLAEHASACRALGDGFGGDGDRDGDENGDGDEDEDENEDGDGDGDGDEDGDGDAARRARFARMADALERR